jgi:hypothetical protein
MARIRVTPATIQSRLQAWNANTGTSRQDELIYYTNDIDAEDWKRRAWELGSMIIDVQPDTVQGFYKIIFVEKL